MSQALDYSLKTPRSTHSGRDHESSSREGQAVHVPSHSIPSRLSDSPKMTMQSSITSCITPTIHASLFNSFSYLLNSMALESNFTLGHLPTSFIRPLNGSAALSSAPILGQAPLSNESVPSEPRIQLPGSGSAVAALLLRRRRTYEDRASDEDHIVPQETSSVKKEKANSDDELSNAYWERRRKNNDAAKRSREARRAKEEEIALRAAYLEQENLRLKAQVAVLKNESARLHCMLIGHTKASM